MARAVEEAILRLPLPRITDHTVALVDRKQRFTSRQRILVVDDNRDAALSLTMLLKILGSEVETALDGQTALQVAETFRPTVVLMDLGMPGMSGYDVAKRMRALPQFEGVTLVALTGWGQDEDRLRTRDAGFDHHLVKPVNLSELQVILR